MGPLLYRQRHTRTDKGYDNRLYPLSGQSRWTSLGYEPLYPGHTAEPESMAWVSQYSNANMVKTDFFEAKSTAYAKSTALVDDL